MQHAGLAPNGPGIVERSAHEHEFRAERQRQQHLVAAIPLLPRLIARTGLLCFLSRHTLGDGGRRGALRELALKETTLRRQLGVTCRREGYLSPAAQRLVTLLRTRGERLFTSALA